MSVSSLFIFECLLSLFCVRHCSGYQVPMENEIGVGRVLGECPQRGTQTNTSTNLDYEMRGLQWKTSESPESLGFSGGKNSLGEGTFENLI